ncbi:hypothetical protein E3P92_00086 [Wallemia ichthyophaga]|uniref:Transcription factor IWS1 n=1 Tax=Wallemia ichthyophaga (strain EXF-994 / CBS 113033) TaxID=1299270 RepID=R9AQ01_WALI9|nr:Transcription factor IWS1 [Wallemia ichthyophaga EXF-994]TIA94392.1 hypothetical protein E3P97_00087 [Wallemia ichthyophaga]EOR04145.1 Transcription factor IWS1 [Wallemia ichthyophaga EXF-994]TIB19145.1 hypothetical protein E3P92_00086 [Wallemia ichthyophaga]TIB36298.1 hypothetical protein E3P85_00082 [Wallemia ichthyophaga]TIB37704.1 hypothetical protein E3P84_00088 [Wallemia ichthyophaga]
MATINPSSLTQEEHNEYTDQTSTQQDLNNRTNSPPNDPTLDPPQEDNELLNQQLAQYPDFSRSNNSTNPITTQKQPKKRHQKQRINRQGSDDDVELDPAAPPLSPEPLLNPSQQARVNLNTKLETIAKGNKKSYRKRKRNDEDLDAAADEELHLLRDQMFTAADQDEDSKKEGKPALNKLRLLPRVIETMQKTHLETSILENNFLDGVRRWLEPFSDKSLPPLNIQTEFFQILSNMYIDTQSLKSSKLGPIILFYSRHSRVNNSIKRAADILVTRWMRPLLRRSANPRSYQFNTSEQVVRSHDVSVNNNDDEQPSSRTRIPEVERKKYKIAATRGIDGIKSSNVANTNQESERQRQLSRKFSMLKRK